MSKDIRPNFYKMLYEELLSDLQTDQRINRHDIYGLIMAPFINRY
jgi:hypothetical protein